MVRGKIRFANRQVFDEFFQDSIDAVSRQSGNRNDLGEIRHFPESFDDGKQGVFGDAVHFVQKQEARSLETRHTLDRVLISLADDFADIQDQGKDIDTIKSSVDFSHHLAAQCGIGTVQTWRIDQHNLRIRPIHNPLNPVSCGLGS